MLTTTQTIDIWTAQYDARKAELIQQGVPAEEAEERAMAEIRQQIRRS